MKNLFPLSLILGLALSSCTPSETTDAHAAHHATEQPTTATPAAGLSDMSLYQLESEWQTEEGQTIKLADLQGKVQVVAMMYTNCTYTCPRIVADLKRIEEGITKYNNSVGIVLVTMDPANDTPEKLKEFAQENNLDPERWQLLTSDEESIQELAVLLNMKYKKSPNGDIAHSNIISVLNAQGEIVHQQEGLGADPGETVKSIEAQLQSM
ncbi:SCO family protein [Pontibacter litorisediminis]|uniref:SCO family protein n=1 Tax=Pontibacter litorisediminis TaxID=1846260 RepID=UPI0023ED0033|nr:SCO family protein [Pontibacter litorisediminis]